VVWHWFFKPQGKELNPIVNDDISKVDGIKKNPTRVRQLLRFIASHITMEASTTTIINDFRSDGKSLSQVSIDQYIKALKSLYVIDDLAAWQPLIRSKTVIRTTPKRHFSDPSIAVAALGITPSKLFDGFKTFSFLFESLCIRDLRVYADSLSGDVYHYRDARGMKVDAIIQLHDGRWGAIEIKMGAGYIEESANKLLKFNELIDTTKMMKPSFLMVLTATTSAYQLNNGVWVVPLGALKN
jgi:predicted AAA+ superfamily ATPase